MQARADGADGDVENYGDLLVGELFEIAEDDDFFEQEGKRFQAFMEGSEGLGPGEEFGGTFVG
jgi:hypothetical protein